QRDDCARHLQAGVVLSVVRSFVERGDRLVVAAKALEDVAEIVPRRIGRLDTRRRLPERGLGTDPVTLSGQNLPEAGVGLKVVLVELQDAAKFARRIIQHSRPKKRDSQLTV